MKVRSGHIKFDKKVKYRSLVPVFRPMLQRFLEETGQMPQEPENFEVLVEENLRDLRKNRKPEGFNRDGTMRMIFPISKGVEFYVYGRGKSTEAARVTEIISKVLQKYKLKHTVEWDKMLLYAERADH